MGILLEIQCQEHTDPSQALDCHKPSTCHNTITVKAEITLYDDDDTILVFKLFSDLQYKPECCCRKQEHKEQKTCNLYLSTIHSTYGNDPTECQRMMYEDDKATLIRC